MPGRLAESLSAYKYTPGKPFFQCDHLSSFEGESKDTGTQYTLKIVKKVPEQLVEYLKKLKSNHSDYVVKIVELVHDPEKSELLIVQEAAHYGSLKAALKKCKRLDDDDSVTLSKIILNGHIELLRQGVYWFGDESDIEFTDAGMKLSWNNSMPFSLNNDNPFPGILARLGVRSDSSSILPFPNNKMLSDLIKVSRENASEMSLHPLLKKKEKVVRKKGREWIGIKESKVKGEYVQELSYLGVSREFGFVRVKFFEKGQLSPELLKVYQTNPSFVKILDHYEEGGNWVTVSEYSNDGTVQNYVKRLKNASLQLKESQIEFFFFSLIEPLKSIHRSSVQSLNMLHIKNIYIQNGIVKVGEPIPLNASLREVLIERSDIPDFYHQDFKAAPDSTNQKYDTYSLGVLTYKLMYTEYPIFPEGKVHIPTAPTYKAKLKNVVELFLNVGGSLEELEQNIEVSEDVKAQVKNNEKALEEGNLMFSKKAAKNSLLQREELQSELSLRQEEEEADGKKRSCFRQCYLWLTKRGSDTTRKYESLQKSNFSSYRQCTMAAVGVLFYFLTFFLVYLQGLYNLLAHTRLFAKVEVNVLGQMQTVIVPNYDQFLLTFQGYEEQSLEVLQNQMHCRIDNQNVYFDFVRPESPHWYAYLLLSIAAMVTILVLKCLQLCRFSTTRVGYHYYDRTIDGANTSRFALSSYVYFQLWFAMALFSFFYLFNYIYHEQHSPCFGGPEWTELTETLMTDRLQFSTNYLLLLLIVFAFGVLSFLQIYTLYSRFEYDQLCNPIFVFTPFYLGLVIALRVGAFAKFNPSWANNEEGIIANGYMNFVGYFPELLVGCEVLLCLLVDLLYEKYLDKKIQSILLAESTFKIDDEDFQDKE